MSERDAVNALRYAGGPEGHYESYFQRANHPTRPLAFWIRYTIFSPKGRPEAALGELWAVYFDGEVETGSSAREPNRPRIAAVKQVFPYASCSFSKRALEARIGPAQLDGAGLSGAAASEKHSLSWQLRYASPESPLLLLPTRMYEAGFPKAKALVGSPQARFQGTLEVDGQTIPVDDWVGSQNHNWGKQHTDRYAWGQVAGFDGRPDVFLECATASVRLGPFHTPPLSPVVLRLGARELRFASVRQALRARARYAPFRWHIESRNEAAAITIEFEGQARDFVALPYDNPPGGQKICLNSKLSACRVQLSEQGKAPLILDTRHRGAFEILRDDAVEGVATL